MDEKAYAAVLTKPRHFDIREVAIPEIGPDEGLLRMEAAGLCGTDYEQFDGHFEGTVYGTVPMTPGHEILGWNRVRRGAGGEALGCQGGRSGDRRDLHPLRRLRALPG